MKMNIDDRQNKDLEVTSPFMYIHLAVCLSVCVGFPGHKEPEANIHFNKLLFSTHKAVITCVGYLNLTG